MDDTGTARRERHRVWPAAGVVAAAIVGAVALAWSLGTEAGFRPTVPAAMAVAAAVLAAAVRLRPKIAVALALLGMAGAAFLISASPEESCTFPIWRFLRHTVEDGAHAHDHSRCQLEGDRRSMAGIVLAVGSVAAGGVVLRRRR